MEKPPWIVESRAVFSECVGNLEKVLHIFRDAEDLTRQDFFVFLIFPIAFRMIVPFGKRYEGNRRVKILM